MSLKDSTNEQNLKDAFAGESQDNGRYLCLVSMADVEVCNDIPQYFVSRQRMRLGTHRVTVSA